VVDIIKRIANKELKIKLKKWNDTTLLYY